MSVGICRGIAEDFGRGPGFTVMYAAACLLLLLIFGRPHLRAFSLKYLLLGVGAANVCAICFIFSLSMAEDATQTMQVGMVNYLWPCLTIVFAVLFNGERARWWIVPGGLLSLLGAIIGAGGFWLAFRTAPAWGPVAGFWVMNLAGTALAYLLTMRRKFLESNLGRE